MFKPRKGSFSKSGNGSAALNDLMLRYAQDGQINNVAGCLLKGADVDHVDGAILTIAIYRQSLRLVKLILAAKPRKGLGAAVKISEQVAAGGGSERFLQLINEYCDKNNIVLPEGE
jgi:hypothetical protein